MLTNRMFKHIKGFDSKWYELGYSDDDLAKLQAIICNDPQGTPVIPGTGGIHKVRFGLDARGKSGGVRVLYGDFPEHGIVYLFAVYPKNEKENIDEDERKTLKMIMNQINMAWRKRK